MRDLHKKKICRKKHATYAKKKSELRLFPQSSYAFLPVWGLSVARNGVMVMGAKKDRGFGNWA